MTAKLMPELEAKIRDIADSVSRHPLTDRERCYQTVLEAYPVIAAHVAKRCAKICSERAKVAHAKFMQQIPGSAEACRWIIIELQASACKDAIVRGFNEKGKNGSTMISKERI